MGLCQRLFAQNVDGFVIQDTRVLIENAVMTMGGERVEGDIADHADIGHLTLQLARRTAGEAVGIVGFTAIGAAQIRWCDREQGNRRDAEFTGSADLIDQTVDGIAAYAGHGVDGFLTIITIEDEDRPDQIIGGQAVFRDHRPLPGVMTVAAHPGARIAGLAGTVLVCLAGWFCAWLGKIGNIAHGKRPCWPVLKLNFRDPIATGLFRQLSVLVIL